MLQCPSQFSRTQAVVVSPYFHGRKENMTNGSQLFKKFCQEVVHITLLTFPWPQLVTWICLISKRVREVQPYYVPRERTSYISLPVYSLVTKYLAHSPHQGTYTDLLPKGQQPKSSRQSQQQTQSSRSLGAVSWRIQDIYKILFS